MPTNTTTTIEFAEAVPRGGGAEAQMVNNLQFGRLAATTTYGAQKSDYSDLGTELPVSGFLIWWLTVVCPKRSSEGSCISCSGGSYGAIVVIATVFVVVVGTTASKCYAVSSRAISKTPPPPTHTQREGGLGARGGRGGVAGG